jgi:hypothetical protein
MENIIGAQNAARGSHAAGAWCCIRTREARLNWDAIGAIGEIVGAAAVVVTLIYLTIQLRQNTTAVEHAVHRGVFEDGQAWLFRLIENPEIVQLYRAGLRGDSLSAEDALRFRFLMQVLFNHWHHARQFGAPHAASPADVASVVATPGGAAYWKRARGEELAGQQEAFKDFVDDILRDIESKKESSV